MMRLKFEQRLLMELLDSSTEFLAGSVVPLAMFYLYAQGTFLPVQDSSIGDLVTH